MLPSATDARSRAPSPGLVFVGLIGVRIAVLALVIHNLLTFPVGDGDLYRFVQIAGSHGLPYRNFKVEYMPVELLAILGVAVGGVVATGIAVALTSFLLEIGVAGALWFGWGLRTANRYLLFGLPLLTVMYRRLDFLPVLLTVAGFALARRDSPRAQRAGGITLGLAVMAKLWPVLLLPVLFLEGRRRSAAWTIGTSIVGALAWLAFGGFSGVHAVFTFRGATAWEAESTIGLILWMVLGLKSSMQQGATRVGHMPSLAGPSLFLATVALAAVIWSRARRSTGDLLGAPALGVLAVLLVFSPLFSLQYIAWVVPWTAIAWPEEHSRRPVLFMLTAICVTGVLLPTYNHVALAIDQTFLLLRNGLVACVALWCLIPRRAFAGPASQADGWHHGT